MVDRKNLEERFLKHNFIDFKWIDPKQIIVSYWVRMKCLFGCDEYSVTATCPPQAPSVSECERFFKEYKEAVVFHFEKKVPTPEDRFAWTRKINLKLLKLEKEIFLSGHEKAFLLFLDSCNICPECAQSKAECKEPKMARPTPEALCVDVYSTVRQLGYMIQVLQDYNQKMNRYAFLMIA
jgi:predicted metal-binding protein